MGEAGRRDGGRGVASETLFPLRGEEGGGAGGVGGTGTNTV